MNKTLPLPPGDRFDDMPLSAYLSPHDLACSCRSFLPVTEPLHKPAASYRSFYLRSVDIRPDIIYIMSIAIETVYVSGKLAPSNK